jgi:hypothetical protein
LGYHTHTFQLDATTNCFGAVKEGLPFASEISFDGTLG